MLLARASATAAAPEVYSQPFSPFQNNRHFALDICHFLIIGNHCTWVVLADPEADPLPLEVMLQCIHGPDLPYRAGEHSQTPLPVRFATRMHCVFLQQGGVSGAARSLARSLTTMRLRWSRLA